MTQTEQVIAAMKEDGGFATFRRLNELIDFSSWGTKTPEASVRRIVQSSNAIFKLRPGLWALEEMREDVLEKLNLKLGDPRSEERFSHGYYQGLLVEIGRFKHKSTYVPPQDRGRLFLGKRLDSLIDTPSLPSFTYDRILRRAQTIDVIWFNQRKMPESFYEVEHTTDMRNSLSKFYELQDLSARFFIVADKRREEEFNDKISASIYDSIRQRVEFRNYSRVVKYHAGLSQMSAVEW